MRKFVGYALLLGLFSLVTFAQEVQNAPKAEFFGGYQYSRLDGGLNANGFDTTLTGNLNRWFGVAADFGGAYNTKNGVSFNQYTYTFGPVISWRRNPTVTPFAHFLAGGSHSSVAFSGLSGSDSGFAMMFGGGLDVKATQHIAVRAVQFDWLSLHSGGVSDNNNMRIATGLLFRY
jgi:hypothetical protein